LAQGLDLPGSVAPFILRGVTLFGIDSVMAPKERRLTAWTRLATDLSTTKLEQITQEITLADALPKAHDIVQGKVRGRLVVNVNA
jgi:acrylyl-CoA reductase (NADPH)